MHPNHASQTQPGVCQPCYTLTFKRWWTAETSLWIMTQKCQLKATGLLSVIARTEILMSLPLRRLRYLPLTDERCGVFPAKQAGLFTVNKSRSADHVFKIHTKHVGRGWVTILRCEQFVTIFISPWSVPSLLLSARAVFCAVFVFTFWSLEETWSAANFIPSPSALRLLNTSLRLWFITALWLSGNSQVMLPVLTTAQNRRLITQK